MEGGGLRTLAIAMRSGPNTDTWMKKENFALRAIVVANYSRRWRGIISHAVIKIRYFIENWVIQENSGDKKKYEKKK